MATEQDFQAWEAAIEQGESPYLAAHKLNTTLTRLRAGDRDRYVAGMELSKEKRAAIVDERVDALARSSEDASLIGKWAKANHPNYRDKQEIEITATVEHEHRGVFAIGDLARVAAELGVLEQLGFARSEEALPAAGELPAGRRAPAERQAGDLSSPKPA